MVNAIKVSVPIVSSKELSEKSIGDTNRGNAWQEFLSQEPPGEGAKC